jgi:prevent-host-death family protein
MRIIDIRDAKIQLSRLIDRAAKGEPFIIAKAGKPLVKVVSLDAEEAKGPRKIGFMEGEFSVPDDFDQMGQDEIARRFGLWSGR